MHFRIYANEIKTSTLATLAPWTSWLSAPRVARRFLRRTDVSVPPLWTSPTPGFLRPFPRCEPHLRAPLRRPCHVPSHGGRKAVRRACARQVFFAAYKRERGCVGACSPRPSRRARRPSIASAQPPAAREQGAARRHGWLAGAAAGRPRPPPARDRSTATPGAALRPSPAAAGPGFRPPARADCPRGHIAVIEFFAGEFM
jgi:hypothetical protein